MSTLINSCNNLTLLGETGGLLGPGDVKLNDDLLKELRKQGFKVECRPELLSNGARRGVLAGPCKFQGSIGPIPVRGLLVVTETATPLVIRELAKLRVAESLPIAIVVTRDEPSKDIQELAGALGVIVTQLGLELKLEEQVKNYTVIPRLDDNSARKIFESKVKGDLLGILGGMLASKKVRFVGLKLVYFPLRCYEVLVHKLDEEDEALEARKANLCFETATGSLVSIKDRMLYIREELVRLGELDDDAVNVIEIVSSIGSASLNEIAEHLGGTERARIITDVLVELGLLEPDYNGLFHVSPLHLEDYTSPITYFKNEGLLTEGRPAKCSKVFEPGFDLGKLDRIVRAFGLVESTSNIYYPLYIGVFRKTKNEKYVDVATIIDGVTGERMEDMEETIADSNMIYQLDRVIEEITGSVSEECPEQEEGSEPARPTHRPEQGSQPG